MTNFLRNSNAMYVKIGISLQHNHRDLSTLLNQSIDSRDLLGKWSVLWMMSDLDKSWPFVKEMGMRGGR